MGIFLWHGLGPGTDTFKQIVHEWNAQHPEQENQVILKQPYSDYGQAAKDALAVPDDAPSSEQPNLVLAPEYMTSTMKEKKILPISQFLDQKQLEAVADIVRKTFGDQNGNLASLPFNPACGMLFYNKEVVERSLLKMGFTADHIPESMEELDNLCRSQGLQWGAAWHAAYLCEMVAAQQDIALVEPDNGRLGYGKFQLSQGWFYDHILDLRAQKRDGVLFYFPKDPYSVEPRKAFLEGRIAFFMQGLGHLAPLTSDAKNPEKSPLPFTVSCAPLPILLKGHTSKYTLPLGGASIWVLDNARTKAMVSQVKDFLAYLASEPVQEKWHKETGYVPALKSIPEKLKTDGFYDVNPLHKAVVAQTIEAPVGNHSFGIHIPGYDKSRPAIFDLLDEVLDLNKSDEDVNALLVEFDEKYSVPKKEVSSS